jgi:membrane associated rhomboid family serine protease
MIPLRDVIPSRTIPFITVAIIVVNGLVWAFEISMPRDALTALLQAHGVVPADFHTPTLVSSMFLHGSWLHVVGNMWVLWIFGDNVEDRLGHARFLVFYLLCGTAAALGQVAAAPASTLPMVGASGALAGVMGAYFVLYPRSRVLTLVPLDIVELPAIVLLGVWLLTQMVSAGAIAVTATSESGGVAFAAHATGFVAGLLGVLAFRRHRHRQWSD